ncbi:hypothetical protein LXL04_028439 [Taraxacum kok-saghyz]
MVGACLLKITETRSIHPTRSKFGLIGVDLESTFPSPTLFFLLLGRLIIGEGKEIRPDFFLSYCRSRTSLPPHHLRVSDCRTRTDTAFCSTELLQPHTSLPPHRLRVFECSSDGFLFNPATPATVSF